MKISFNDKTQTPRFQLEDKDISDAREIGIMLKTRGWEILKDYILVARESILEAGKDGVRTRAKRELSSEKWSVLKGGDECALLPERVVKRAKDYEDEEAKNRKDEETTSVDNEDN